MKPRIVILGGAGAMGRITARDLARTSRGRAEVVIADRDRRADGIPGVRTVPCDVTDGASLRRALTGAWATIASLPYRFNPPAMEGALEAGAPPPDLGGLFHITRRPLALAPPLERAGRHAIPGLSAPPARAPLRGGAARRAGAPAARRQRAGGRHGTGAARRAHRPARPTAKACVPREVGPLRGAAHRRARPAAGARRDRHHRLPGGAARRWRRRPRHRYRRTAFDRRPAPDRRRDPAAPRRMGSRAGDPAGTVRARARAARDAGRRAHLRPLDMDPADVNAQV